MDFITLFWISLGLSMDAFAAAICVGLAGGRSFWRLGLTTAAFFGGAQALMPVFGWILGWEVQPFAEAAGPWIAFILLGYIGGKMVYDSFFGAAPEEQATSHKSLFFLALATSIDAMAVGVSFALLGEPIWSSTALIGATTFSVSLLGVWIGRRFGIRFRRGAMTAGGVVLFLMGLRILLTKLYAL